MPLPEAMKLLRSLSTLDAEIGRDGRVEEHVTLKGMLDMVARCGMGHAIIALTWVAEP